MSGTSLPCVLVVEDNDAVRESLALFLGREDYRVILAANGEEALDHLHGGVKPDLILLDMLMPVLDGWHFLGRLKQEGPEPPVPILIVTSTILTRQWAEDHGCSGFVHKPIEPEVLLEEVRRCLNK